MSDVRRSLAFSALDSYVGFALQVVSTVVIARILTPEQTGIFAVAAVFAALANTFRDFGVAEYLIQERTLDDDSIRAALSVNIAVSWLMALLLFALASPASAFYRTDGVGDVMRVQAANFLLIPFGAVTMAWFRRELNFRPIFIASALGNITAFVVAVTLALDGHGYMSLAWSSLAGTAVTVGASVWMRPASIPRLPGVRRIGKVVSFGKFATGIYVLGQLGRGAPEMIIGRAQDMAAVGMFSRAYGLVEIFQRLVLRAAMPICLPYFARDVRNDGTPQRGLLTAMGYLTAIGWPFFAFMALVSYAAVRLLYGPQWLDAVPLAKVLCVAAALDVAYAPSKEAMLAMGKPREGNRLQLQVQGLRVLGLLAAVPYGLPGACWGLLAAAALGALVAHRQLVGTVGVSFAAVASALAPSAGVTLIAASPVAVLLALAPLDDQNYLLVGSVAGLVFCVAWLLALRLLKHPLWNEIVRLARDALASAQSR